MRRTDTLSKPAHKRHLVNLKNHGQWQVLDDGGLEAKVQTTDQAKEFIVNLGPKPTCSCFEL